MSRHLELETLSALLDRELDGAAAKTAQAHVDGCPECRARLDGLSATVHQLRSLPPAAPPPHVHEALRRRLAIEQEVRRRLWTLPGWHAQLAAWPAMAAAVFLAFGCGIFLYAYLLRHPALIRPTEPIGQEGDWQATITYDRPSDDGAAGAATPPPPAAAPRPQSRQAAADRVAQPPAAAEARRERQNALSKSAATAPELDELQVAAEAAPESREERESSPARQGGAAAPAPAPAALAAPRADAKLEAGAAGAVVPLGPGVEPPVRTSGENPDFRALRDVRIRHPLVIAEGVVGVDGILRDIALRPADLDPRLAAAVRKSLATWRFEPARKGGEPVAVRYVLTLNIDLR